MTLHVQSTSYELRHLLGNSDAKCLITQGALAKRFEEIRDELPSAITSSRRTDWRRMALPGDHRERSLLDGDPEIEGDDPAVMIYTAGLTGKPLGAVLTHHNLLTQSELLRSIAHRDEKGISDSP